MQIVELEDCSMVIMKDSCDPFWVSVGDVYRKANAHGYNISVMSDDGTVDISSDYICSAGRLVLFFKDSIKDKFHLHASVSLELAGESRY